ncbi:unnamed protein product [Vitrella brassicaformis CCMP3155]|uniref:Sushi domain-containing protein n=1 Tax=Vitrella brassicaformis (strain CCMP3155) TaxID=1169540 RepID=A0A0G4EJC7_VITBC|nr:unnamed protein product [Vitrella brassicaformis CCMP3155]|eukprot:CEL96607.1 unnamed protein product [Vitrella brassicaformis CCMP3155]
MGLSTLPPARLHLCLILLSASALPRSLSLPGSTRLKGDKQTADHLGSAAAFIGVHPFGNRSLQRRVQVAIGAGGQPDREETTRAAKKHESRKRHVHHSLLLPLSPSFVTGKLSAGNNSCQRAMEQGVSLFAKPQYVLVNEMTQRVRRWKDANALKDFSAAFVPLEEPGLSTSPHFSIGFGVRFSGGGEGRGGTFLQSGLSCLPLMPDRQPATAPPSPQGVSLFLLFDITDESADRRNVIFDSGAGFQVVTEPDSASSSAQGSSGRTVLFGVRCVRAPGPNQTETDVLDADAWQSVTVRTSYGRPTLYSILLEPSKVQGKMTVHICRETPSGKYESWPCLTPNPDTTPPPMGNLIAPPPSLRQPARMTVGCNTNGTECFQGVLETFLLRYKWINPRSQAFSLPSSRPLSEAFVEGISFIQQQQDPPQKSDLTRVGQDLNSVLGRKTVCGNGIVEQGEECDAAEACGAQAGCSCACEKLCETWGSYQDKQGFTSRHLLTLHDEGTTGSFQGDYRMIGCGEGFSCADRTKPKEKIVCGQGGKWADATLDCRQDCVVPFDKSPRYEPSLAVLTNPPNDTKHGTVLDVGCKGGTDLEESLPASLARDKTKCLDGEWTPVGLRCHAMCPEYPDLGVSVYKVTPARGSGSLKYGATRTIECEPPYVPMAGPMRDVVYCLNGNWTRRTIHCAKGCDTWIPVSHTVIVRTSATTESAVDGSKKHQLNQVTGPHHWIDVGCDPQTSSPSCRKAARPGCVEDPQRIFCIEEKWTPPLRLQCIENCPGYDEFPLNKDPTVAQRYEIAFGGNRHGDVTVVRCREGYDSVIGGMGMGLEEDRVRCWYSHYEHVTIQCLQRCGPYTRLPDGFIVRGDGTRHGDTRTLQCDADKGFLPLIDTSQHEGQGGTEIHNTETVTCIDGYWSPRTLQCRHSCSNKFPSQLCLQPAGSLKCEGLYVIALNHTNTGRPPTEMPQTFHPGSTILFSCDRSRAFSPDGEDPLTPDSERIEPHVLRCLGDADPQNAWTAFHLTCRRACPTSAFIRLGARFQQRWAAEWVDTRYEGKSWRYSQLVEAQANHELPPYLAHNSRVSITCAEGYTSRDAAQRVGEGVEGSEEITCYDGRLEPTPTLDCARACGPFRPLGSAYAVESFPYAGANFHGARRHIKCSPGADALTEATEAVSECQDGTWDDFTLLCERSCPPLADLDGNRYVLTQTIKGKRDAAKGAGATYEIRCQGDLYPSTGESPYIVKCEEGDFTPILMTCGRNCQGPPFYSSRYRWRWVSPPSGPTPAWHHMARVNLTCAPGQSAVRSEHGYEILACIDGQYTKRTLVCRRDCPAEYPLRPGYTVAAGSASVAYPAPGPVPHDTVRRIECDTDNHFRAVEGATEEGGAAEVKCIDGEWTFMPLVCRQDCPFLQLAETPSDGHREGFCYIPFQYELLDPKAVMPFAYMPSIDGTIDTDTLAAATQNNTNTNSNGTVIPPTTNVSLLAQREDPDPPTNANATTPTPAPNGTVDDILQALLGPDFNATTLDSNATAGGLELSQPRSIYDLDPFYAIRLVI